MPHYRLGIIRALLRHKEITSYFLFSNEDPRDIKKINLDSFEKFYLERFIFTKNFWLKKKVLFWQKNVLKNVLMSNYDSIVFLGEMYIITNWIGALIARLRNKKVVFWGHGLYGNESFIKKIFRKLFLKLPHLNLLYENHAKKIMIHEGFKDSKIDVIYNSIETLELDFSKDYYKLKNNFFSNNNLPCLVFVGRLTKIKKLDLLIEAILITNSEKNSFNLLIIGAGEEENNLKILAKKGLDEGFIKFYGECYDQKILSDLISRSNLCVSPGNVGLTAIQSLAYGTPVCTHNNFNNQMPEANSIKEGYNGTFFKENNLESLVETISKWKYDNKKLIHKNCINTIKNRYNFKNQIKIFEKHLL